jgi:hypothetical protein
VSAGLIRAAKEPRAEKGCTRNPLGVRALGYQTGAVRRLKCATYPRPLEIPARPQRSPGVRRSGGTGSGAERGVPLRDH